MARAGNIREAQAIMKGFKRQVNKQMAPMQQSEMMQNFSEQVQDVYGALGEAADSAGEEELDQVVSMSRPSASMMQSSNMMMSSAAMPRGGSRGMEMASADSMMMQDESCMMGGSAAESK